MRTEISDAVAAIGRGEIVIVTDNEDRENEGDLVMAAEAATEAQIALFLRHTSGLICVALTAQRCEALNLELMVQNNTEAQGTAFTVSVDAIEGTSTGISAGDRAKTLSDLADPARTTSHFARPGHVFPLRARAGGVLKRAGHTEAALDLTKMAGLAPAGVLCEVVTSDKRAMADRAQLERIAVDHGMPMVTIDQLVRHRLCSERLVRETGCARVPTRHGDFDCHAWTSLIDGTEHLALVLGDVTGLTPVLVRVHSECLTGDVFGSRRCDCGTQLDDALAAIASAGRGALIYLRGHEGRGIGISHKLGAYQLQDAGYDTVDANLALGLPVDTREYGMGAQILMDMGIRRLRLMTNSPLKYRGLVGFGLDIVERVSMPSRVTPENLRYLQTKRERLDHDLPDISSSSVDDSATGLSDG